jgi:predicted AlkP superfamily pyrophosphatase or phosphodiesterase
MVRIIAPDGFKIKTTIADFIREYGSKYNVKAYYLYQIVENKRVDKKWVIKHIKRNKQK